MEKIRKLTFDDEDVINELVKKSLENKDELSVGNLLPTDRNVESFFRLEIFPILFEDDPILGYFEEDKLLGFSCCSTKANKLYDLKESSAIGGITICDPEFRRRGIGSKLRLSITKELKSRNIKKFIFEIKCDNEASLSNAQKISKELNADAELISFRFGGKVDVF